MELFLYYLLFFIIFYNLLVRSLQEKEPKEEEETPLKEEKWQKVIIKEKVTRQMSLSLGSTKCLVDLI